MKVAQASIESWPDNQKKKADTSGNYAYMRKGTKVIVLKRSSGSSSQPHTPDMKVTM
jgi:hypothetical protein